MMAISVNPKPCVVDMAIYTVDPGFDYVGLSFLGNCFFVVRNLVLIPRERIALSDASKAGGQY